MVPDAQGLGSFNKNQMKVNADGSDDLYVGPKAPAGLESNWIPTMGKEPYLGSGSMVPKKLSGTSRSRCLMWSLWTEYALAANR